MIFPAFRRLRRARFSRATLLAVFLFGRAARAADPGVDPDYATLSLEQLSSIKVTSVAKKQQRLSRTAAAVYVITSEEIHRSGLTSVPEVLRLAPGLSVARIDASTWAVSSRGFNGFLANKLMVLIDGRSVYSPLFSGVYWDTAMPLLDDIERIEVIRGAGATMWGANAVNGVINIITRSAKDVRGKEVVASAGTTERAAGEIRGGGSIGNVAYRAYMGGRDTDRMQTAAGQGAHDGWSSEQGGFRMDTSQGADTWTVEGDFFRNTRFDNGLIPSLQSPPDVAFYTRDTAASGSLAGEWRRQIREGSELRVNAYYDDTDHPRRRSPWHIPGRAIWKFSTDSPRVAATTSSSAPGTVFPACGSPGTANTPSVSLAFFTTPPARSHRTRSICSATALLLTGGLKIEHDPVGGWEAQPNARILWAPNAKQSVWASVGRAVRTPDPYELFGTASLAAVPPSSATDGLLGHRLSSRDLRTSNRKFSDDYEIGYRVQPSPRFSLDWTAFFNDYSQLRRLDPLPPVLHRTPVLYAVFPFTYSNFARAHGEGSEVSAILASADLLEAQRQLYIAEAPRGSDGERRLRAVIRAPTRAHPKISGSCSRTSICRRMSRPMYLPTTQARRSPTRWATFSSLYRLMSASTFGSGGA